MMIVTMKKRKK